MQENVIVQLETGRCGEVGSSASSEPSYEVGLATNTPSPFEKRKRLVGSGDVMPDTMKRAWGYAIKSKKEEKKRRKKEKERG